MKKILKIVLALMMAFGIQVATFSNVNAQEVSNLPDGKYTVPTSLMNASNIANASMAGGALSDTGELVVENGQWSLIAEFKTLDFGNMGTMFGNASDIKYYEDGLGSTKVDAKIISYRTDNKGVSQVEKVEIPVAANSKGIYISMFVDFMQYAPDAYIAFSTDEVTKTVLTSLIDDAKAKDEANYTASSYVALQTAISNAEAVLDGSEAEMAAKITALQNALKALENIYHLADGTYTVASDVLKADKDEQSMAAQAVKSATVKATNGELLVTLQMGAVSVYGQTAYIDNMEVEQADGTYKAVEITGRDSDDHVSEVQFSLTKNTKLTNVKFYYGGSTRGSEARLSLGLDNPTKVVESKFASDGTYNVDVALWNATQDQASMAASAIDSKATVVVKDGVATMYLTTKEMTMGTIKAWLEELYIGSSSDDYKSNPATIVSKNADGKVTMWSFTLPNEDELFDVVVNPHVAIMGNVDIPARIKVDYRTLTYVSDSTDAPKSDTNENTGNTNNTDNTGNSGNIDNSGNTENTDNTGNTSSSVKTGDDVQMELIGGLLISSLALAAYVTRMKLCK